MAYQTWPTKLPALFCTLVVTMDRVMIKTLNYVDQRRLTLGSDSWLLAQQQRAQTCKTVFRNDMLFCVAPSTVTLCHAPVVSTFVFSLQSLHCLYSSSLIFWLTHHLSPHSFATICIALFPPHPLSLLTSFSPLVVYTGVLTCERAEPASNMHGQGVATTHITSSRSPDSTTKLNTLHGPFR